MADKQRSDGADGRGNNNEQETKFDIEFGKLYKILDETVKAKYSTKIQLGEQIEVAINLTKYKAAYDLTKKSNSLYQHIKYFKNCYSNNRDKILAYDDRWLLDNRIIIQYGEGDVELNPKVKMIRIKLSEIYSIAVKLMEAAQKKSDDGSTLDASETKDLVRYEWIQYYLYRTFYYIVSTEDKPKILEIIRRIESNMGIDNGPAPSPSSSSSPSPNSNSGGSGLESILQTAVNASIQNGVVPPSDFKVPSGQELGNMFDRIINNEATQGLIKGFVGNLSSARTLDEAFKVMGNVISNGGLKETFEATLATTAQSAVSPNNNNAAPPQ